MARCHFAAVQHTAAYGRICRVAESSRIFRLGSTRLLCTLILDIRHSDFLEVGTKTAIDNNGLFCFFLIISSSLSINIASVSANGVEMSPNAEMAYWSIIDWCVKNWQYFRKHGMPLNSVSNSLSYDIVRFKIEVGLKRNSCAKMYQNKRNTSNATGAITLPARWPYARPRFHCQHARAVRSQ